jgi:division protein CdvB (Snf7/Vps24/ESCRT-III family)
MSGVYEIQSIILKLHNEYTINWNDLNKLFKLQTQIESMHQKFINNYRLNNHISKLQEIIKVKIDQKWVEKTGNSLQG